MHCLEKKIEKLKSMHTSNLIFMVFGKFLGGLGLGILLATYFWNPLNYWLIAGWMFIVFAVIVQIPALITVSHKKGKEVESRKK